MRAVVPRGRHLLAFMRELRFQPDDIQARGRAVALALLEHLQEFLHGRLVGLPRLEQRFGFSASMYRRATVPIVSYRVTSASYSATCSDSREARHFWIRVRLNRLCEPVTRASAIVNGAVLTGASPKVPK